MRKGDDQDEEQYENRRDSVRRLKKNKKIFRKTCKK